MKTSFVFVFRRRLQDFLIKANIFTLLKCFQKTSSRHLDQNQYIRLGHTSSRRLQDALQKRLQDIFKTSSRRFQDVFKTSLRHLQGFLLRRLQDVFKRKTFLRYLQNVFKTFWRRLQDLLNTSSRHLEWCLPEVFKTYYKVFCFFLSGFSFADTVDSQDSRGMEGIIFYSTLPLSPAHEHADIYLQLCMWDDYHIFLSHRLYLPDCYSLRFTTLSNYYLID